MSNAGATVDEEAILQDTDKMLNATAQAKHLPPAEPSWWSTTNAMTMCTVILLFGLVVLSLSAWLIRVGQHPTSVLRVFGTVLVIVMATFLVVAGYDDKQIAAPLGLLGTIGGYLLGKETNRPPEGPRPE